MIKRMVSGAGLRSATRGIAFFAMAFTVLTAQAVVDKPLIKKDIEADIQKKKEKNEVIEMQVEQNIFNRTFKKEFKKGPIKDVTLLGGHIGYYLFTRKNGANVTHNEIDNNLPIFGFKGHFKDDTMFCFSYLPWYKIKNYEKAKHRIFQYFLRKNLGEHHKLTLGQDRTPTGVEGSTSMFSLTTGRRSLIAKKYNNITAIGARLDGKYDWIEYRAGIFDSGRMLKNNFREAPEFAGLVFFKPIPVRARDKYGNFTVGGGYNKGKLDYNYDVLTFYTAYDYKKWHWDWEFNHADGYNSYVNSQNKSYGYYTTLLYKVTDKFQVFTRAQGFDPNKEVVMDMTKQYEAGVNYFIRGKKLRLTASYVYTDNDGAADANQIFFSTQIML